MRIVIMRQNFLMKLMMILLTMLKVMMMTIFQANLMPSDAAVLFAAFSWASSR